MDSFRKIEEFQLFKSLKEKIKLKKGTSINLINLLERFIYRVSHEIKYILYIFPQYTPHDDDYHINNLFCISEQIIGEETLDNLGCLETFILIAAIYGHDWGMAINEKEKELIQNIIFSKDCSKLNEFIILQNEKNRFIEFAIKNDFIKKDVNELNSIPDELWKNYIRETHAERSSLRIYDFFKNENEGIAFATSMVASGHWKDFELLENDYFYPIKFPVLRESVNIRALAIYLRLLDLFDFGEDRTPYVLWKFVAPLDRLSKLEWSKHRALMPIIVDSDQIIVRGSTSDYEVYLALENFKEFCFEQFNHSLGILDNIRDSNYQTIVKRIKWEINTEGFEKYLVRFEFDREAMFKILSDEIYQGNQYIFIRELLQNSIDAIKTRREIFKKRGFKKDGYWKITAEIEEEIDDFIILKWTDDGVGMDFNIVKEYLAVAGKSYYTSKDFEREDLNFHPFSKFGIGILSCFMISDHIEIETFKDLNFYPEAKPLKIIISDYTKYFIIKEINDSKIDIGTSIKVFISKRKITENFSIVDYLKKIAGFVEFPILIVNKKEKVLIANPYEDENNIKKYFGEDIQIYRINLEHPLTNYKSPKSFLNINDFFKLRQINISKELGLDGYDGVINLLEPINENIDISDAPAEGRLLLIRNKDEKIEVGYDWGRDAVYLAEKSFSFLKYSVFREGILVPKAEFPKTWIAEYPSPVIPSPQIIVNISIKNAPEIDLSRSTILKPGNWYDPIYKRYVEYIIDNYSKYLIKLDIDERFFQLGRLKSFYLLNTRLLWDYFPKEHWPILYFQKGKGILILEWKELNKKEIIYSLPRYLHREIRKAGYKKWINISEYNGPLLEWKGEDSIIFKMEWISNALTEAAKLSTFAINNFYEITGFNLLQPPQNESLPLLQWELTKKVSVSNEEDLEKFLETGIKNPLKLNFSDKLSIPNELKIYDFPPAFSFKKPFEEYYGYGWKVLNIKHPFVIELLKLIATIKLSEIKKRLDTNKIIFLNKAIQELPGTLSKSLDYEDFKMSILKLFETAKEYDLVTYDKNAVPIPKPDEFIKNTINKDLDINTSINYSGNKESFGMPYYSN